MTGGGARAARRTESQEAYLCFNAHSVNPMPPRLFRWIVSYVLQFWMILVLPLSVPSSPLLALPDSSLRPTSTKTLKLRHTETSNFLRQYADVLGDLGIGCRPGRNRNEIGLQIQGNEKAMCSAIKLVSYLDTPPRSSRERALGQLRNRSRQAFLSHMGIVMRRQMLQKPQQPQTPTNGPGSRDLNGRLK